MSLTFKITGALIFFISVLFHNPTGLENHVTKTAIIEFETEVIDYGTILQHSDGKRTFTFTNKGEAPLIITDVKTSCGCTVANYTKEPVLQGQTGRLEVGYDTKRLGAFSKTITVFSNTEEGRTTLKIKGEIVAVE